MVIRSQQSLREGGCAVLRQVEKLCQALTLAHPHDRHGALLKDRASSAELDAALEAYRQACARACEDVRAQLRGLARSLMVRACPLSPQAMSQKPCTLTQPLPTKPRCKRDRAMLCGAEPCHVGPAAPACSPLRVSAARSSHLPQTMPRLARARCETDQPPPDRCAIQRP